MATVATTTVTNPLRYPGSSYVEYQVKLPPDGASTGYLFAMVQATTANTFDFYRSINGGTTWSVFSTITRANVVEAGPIYCDFNGWLHWAYRTNESSEDRIYYRRMDATGVWSTEVMLASFANGGSAGSIYQGIDFMIVNYGSIGENQVGCFVVGTNVSGKMGVSLYGTRAIFGLSPAQDNGAIAGNRQQIPNTGSGRVGPSVDVEHNGTAKITGSSPNLWIAFGRTAVNVLKLAWNGSGWNVSTSSTDLAGTVTAANNIPARWDGSRFLILRPSGTQVVMLERNRANTSTTTRTTPGHTAGVIRSCALNYNSANGNPRVYAVGTSNDDVYYVDFDRNAGTWGSWVVVTATDILGVDNYSLRRGTAFDSKYDILTAASGAPNVITHTAQGLVMSPLTPTWNFTSVPYTNGSAADVNASVTLDWDFNDPDPLDTQGSYAISRQIGAGALNYWRASDSTWQVAEVQNTSSTTQLTLASSWASGSDANYTFKVKTWDAGGLPSAYSTGLVLVPSVKVNPTISTPVDLSTWPIDKVTVTWTVGEQTAYRTVLCFFGIPLDGTDSGKVSSTATSHTFTRTMENAFNFTVRLWTWNNEGLQSDMDENSFIVRFVPPRVPTITCSPNPTGGYITVRTTNPAAATFVNAGTAAQGNNVTLNPALPTGTTGDLLLVMSAIENSGTGTPNLPTPTYTSLATFGNIGLFGKLREAGESAPSVSFAGGVAGAATSAQMVAFREAALAAIGSPFTQLNGSAQNILYLGGTPVTANCIMILIVWKQDGAATVTTTPAGFTKIGDIFNSNGQTVSWYYQIQTTATAVSSGTVTVTSGVSAISRSMLVSISGVPLVLYNDIWRIRSTSFGDQIRVIEGVAVNGAGNDWRALSGQEYLYQAIAYGDNGSSAPGLFTQ